MVLYSTGCILALITKDVLAQYIHGPTSPRTDNEQVNFPCFQAGIENVHMANYQSVGRYPASHNPSVCIRYCEQIKCKSFVYDSIQNMCLLYNVRVHESTGYLKYHPYRTYYELSRICKKLLTTPVLPSYTYSTSSSPPPSTTTSTAVSTTTTTTEFLDCNPDERVAISGQVGVEANDEPTFETKQYRKFEDCLDGCVQNLGPGGQPLRCKAFEYNIATFNCALFDFEPDTATPNEALSVLYGQKVCLSVRIRNLMVQDITNQVCRTKIEPVEHVSTSLEIADAVSLCSNEVPAILTGPNYVLIGNVLDEIGSVSYEECVAACFKDAACKSGNYYPATKECLLKDITRTTNPALYISEEGTTYFDHDCVRSVFTDFAGTFN